MPAYYNRYSTLNNDEEMLSPPFVKLTEKGTDTFVQYDANKSRLDKISQQYYGSPYYGWLILMANPQYGGLEWKIGDGEAIRVPLPFDDTLKEYRTKLRKRLEYYGY